MRNVISGLLLAFFVMVMLVNSATARDLVDQNSVSLNPVNARNALLQRNRFVNIKDVDDIRAISRDFRAVTNRKTRADIENNLVNLTANGTVPLKNFPALFDAVNLGPNTNISSIYTMTNRNLEPGRFTTNSIGLNPGPFYSRFVGLQPGCAYPVNPYAGVRCGIYTPAVRDYLTGVTPGQKLPVFPAILINQNPDLFESLIRNSPESREFLLSNFTEDELENLREKIDSENTREVINEYLKRNEGRLKQERNIKVPVIKAAFNSQIDNFENGEKTLSRPDLRTIMNVGTFNHNGHSLYYDADGVIHVIE